MTTAELCGQWWRAGKCRWTAGRYRVAHRCDEPTNHPAPCTCRCGATTTRPEGATS